MYLLFNINPLAVFIFINCVFTISVVLVHEIYLFIFFFISEKDDSCINLASFYSSQIISTRLVLSNFMCILFCFCIVVNLFSDLWNELKRKLEGAEELTYLAVYFNAQTFVNMQAYICVYVEMFLLLDSTGKYYVQSDGYVERQALTNNLIITGWMP